MSEVGSGDRRRALRDADADGESGACKEMRGNRNKINQLMRSDSDIYICTTIAIYRSHGCVCVCVILFLTAIFPPKSPIASGDTDTDTDTE